MESLNTTNESDLFWCKLCETTARCNRNDLLPIGWGWTQQPDWVSHPFSGATGPFFACQDCKD